jgi:hypothetical protein
VSENDRVFCEIVRGEMESEVAREVAQKLGVAQSGCALPTNDVPDAGQEVFYLHAVGVRGKGMGMP